MTEDDDIPLDSADPADSAAAPREVVRQLLLKVGRSVPVETERLGTIQAREMTMAMANALLQRLPADDALSEAEVARIFMGCATGIPEPEHDSASEPLSEAEAGELTEADVQRFAPVYLHEVLHQPASDDSVRDVAAHARAQRREHAERLAAFGKTMQEQLRRVTGNAELMKNWSTLQDTLGGSFKRFQDEFKRITGPSGLLSDSMRAVLEANKSDALRAMLDAGKNDPLRAVREAHKLGATPIYAPLPTMEPLRLPPISETPLGRTADAVESLRAAGDRMERAVNAIVEQAGEVSDLIIGVSSTIQTESKTFQEQTKASTQSAVRYAQVSLAVSAGALIISALMGVWGFGADRADARAEDQQAAKLLAQVQAQNTHLARLIAQQQQQLDAQRNQGRAQLRALEAMSDKLVPPAPVPAATKKKGKP